MLAILWCLFKLAMFFGGVLALAFLFVMLEEVLGS